MRSRGEHEGLGELLYEGVFKYIIFHPNDANGHLSSLDYFNYCRLARADFLKQFKWSDEFFNYGGLSQRRRKFEEVVYRKPLFKNDKIKVNLRITLENRNFLKLLFDFYNPNGELSFSATAYDFFVKISEGKEDIIQIPDFFLKTLRESKKD